MKIPLIHFIFIFFSKKKFFDNKLQIQFAIELEDIKLFIQYLSINTALPPVTIWDHKKDAFRKQQQQQNLSLIHILGSVPFFFKTDIAIDYRVTKQ